MADKEPRQPTHRAYSVIKREGQDDYWLNVGLVFPHKDGGGFNIMLQAFPLDGKIVCREITAEDDQQTGAVTPLRSPQRDRQGGTGRGRFTQYFLHRHFVDQVRGVCRFAECKCNFGCLHVLTTSPCFLLSC